MNGMNHINQADNLSFLSNNFVNEPNMHTGEFPLKNNIIYIM